MNTYIKLFLIISVLFVNFSLINSDNIKRCKIDNCRISTPKSDRGEKGDAGIAGPRGEKGDSGVPGIPGIPGWNGLKGDRGEKGDAGIAGPRGVKGDRGDPGVPGIPGWNGVKGDRGETGIPGMNGLKGDNGDKGAKGDLGSAGQKGDNGDQGEKGDSGDNGPKGENEERGEKGDPGSEGLKGENGEAGQKGDKGELGPEGLKGATGLRGPRGINGVCSCPDPNQNGSSDSDPPISQRDPLPKSCKYIEDVKNQSYEISKDENTVGFFVYCNGQSTCIKPKETNPQHIKYNGTKHFMCSSYGFNSVYDIEKGDLLYLHSISTRSTQKITISCMDSTSHSVAFVSWNDLMVRHDTDENNPFFSYTVENDGCKDSGTAKENQKLSDISLSSDKAERLPITDVYVRDARGDEVMSIQLGDLCFD